MEFKVGFMFQEIDCELIGAAWVERGGIVGRGVLLDYASWADSNNVALTPFETNSITVETLKKVAESQGTIIRQGDILFIRTGWVRAYDRLTDEECKALADHKVPPAHGVESSEETLRWLWDQGFAAVAGDQPSMEAWPCQNTDFFLHEWLLAGWGMPIGELFDLEVLSKECEKRQRWSFFFTSMPLKVSSGDLHLDLKTDRIMLVGPWRRSESTEWRSDLLIN